MATREQIFEFDASQSIDSIKNLRDEIKRLKTALEQLEIGSDEYKETAEELRKQQSKLTDVIKDAKSPYDDAADSINKMNRRLRELTAEWRAADAEGRKNLTPQIVNLKKQVNEANESVLNFQHNVGNYTQSIVDAFGKMGIGVEKPIMKMSSIFSLLNGGLDKAAEAFKKLWTVIATNPLGALLAVLGTLIVFWDDLKDAISSIKTPYQKVIDQTTEFSEALKDTQTELNRTIKLMSAMGADEIEVAAFRTNELKNQLEQTNSKLKDQEDELADLEKWWKRIGRAVLSVLQYIVPISEYTYNLFGMGGKVDGLKESIEKLKEEQKGLNNQVKDAQDDEFIAYLKKDKEATDKSAQSRKEASEAARLEGEAIKWVQDQIDESLKKRQDDFEKRQEMALNLLQSEMDKQKTELELEEESYEEKKALLEEFGLSTEELEENHLERMAEIRAEESRRIYKELEEQAAEKKRKDDEVEANYKKLMKARETATKNMVSGTTGLLKNLSVAMGENTKLGKGFAIAAATIDTIASAVAGFRAGMNQWADAGPMAWMAPVQAAINATAALVAGFAEVQKIKSVDTSGNSEGGGGMATALAMPNIEGLSSPVDYTRQVTTETEQEEMNRNNRVYILESDIQESGNRVKVREEETTF